MRMVIKMGDSLSLTEHPTEKNPQHGPNRHSILFLGFEMILCLLNASEVAGLGKLGSQLLQPMRRLTSLE